MPTPPGKIVVGAYVDRELAERFRAWARTQKGGISGVLRDFMEEKARGQAPQPPPGVAGNKLTIRLRDQELEALCRLAEARSVTPTTWLRSLASAHLGRRPQWNGAELDELRRLFTEVRRIGANVNQIARAMNVASHTGEYPAGQAQAVRELVDQVRTETRRIVAVLSGNFDYWGLPEEERPRSAYGAVERDAAQTAKERRRRKLLPRRRPARVGAE